MDPLRPFVYVSRILNLDGEGCESFVYEGVDYGTRLVAVYDISDLAAPKLMGYFTIDEWKERTRVHLSFGSDGTTVAVYMQAAGLVFYDFTDPVNPVVLSETLQVPSMNEEAVRTAPYTLGYLDAREAAPGRWYAIASSDGITSSIEVLTLSPSSDAPPPEPAPETPKTVGEGETCTRGLAPQNSILCADGLFCYAPPLDSGAPRVGGTGTCQSSSPPYNFTYVVGLGQQCTRGLAPQNSIVCADGLLCSGTALGGTGTCVEDQAPEPDAESSMDLEED